MPLGASAADAPAVIGHLELRCICAAHDDRAATRMANGVGGRLCGDAQAGTSTAAGNVPSSVGALTVKRKPLQQDDPLAAGADQGELVKGRRTQAIDHLFSVSRHTVTPENPTNRAIATVNRI